MEGKFFFAHRFSKQQKERDREMKEKKHPPSPQLLRLLIFDEGNSLRKQRSLHGRQKNTFFFRCGCGSRILDLPTFYFSKAFSFFLRNQTGVICVGLRTVEQRRRHRSKRKKKVMGISVFLSTGEKKRKIGGGYRYTLS